MTDWKNIRGDGRKRWVWVVALLAAAVVIGLAVEATDEPNTTDPVSRIEPASLLDPRRLEP